MLTGLLETLRSFFASTVPWVIVSPWEEALRVRAGKRVKSLGAGFHFKIPVLDRFYIQSVRTRIADLGRQTLSTSDGKTVTISGVVEYEIVDIEALYNTLHHPQDTIINCAKSELIRQVAQLGSKEITRRLEYPLESELLGNAGIKVKGISLIDCAVVRTYRLIGDNERYPQGDSLDTEQWVN